MKNERGWRAPLTMDSIAGDTDQQLRFVDDCTAPFRAKLAGLRVHEESIQANGSDEGYGKVESDFLYCFVRRHRPRTIIQVGCGVSTAVCLMAAKDEQYKPRIVCIEPYPTKFLVDSHQAGDIELVHKKVEDANPRYFHQISAGDLLFIDSSHTLGPNGEVNRLVGILPKIAAGAYVHFHDIWFPYDYCPNLLSTDLFFHLETSLLYAFLCMNDAYSIAASLSLLFHSNLAELQRFLPVKTPGEFSDGIMIKHGNHPTSIYLRRS